MAPRLDFHWNLRQVMIAHHIWKAAQLAPLLRERGIGLSESQVRRLVARKPQRLSMDVLIALCDIFGCQPGDLIEPYAAGTADPATASGDAPAPAGDPASLPVVIAG